ncbi:nucleic acid binding domain protein [Halorubrum phage Hardycor1]|nr:nucleic acid binding domain protein [Halorubrum phage Hardycor1]
MSAATDADAGSVSYDPDAIRDRLPSGTTARQDRILICAIRNPDASPYEIAHAAAVESGEAVRALSNVANGLLGDREYAGTRQARERRGRQGRAENYAELTDKQRAIVDYRARHDPEFDLDGATVARAINASDDYDVTVDATTVPSFENGETYRDIVEELVDERRDLLVSQGEVGDGDDAAEAAHRLETREYLTIAGYDLPDSNLDDLDRVGDGLDDSTLLDLAYENGEGGGPEPTEYDAIDVSALPAADHVGDPTFDDENVRPEVVYAGLVNGVVEWGVWVTIGGDPNDPGDVSGVVPVERMSGDPSDYEVGEAVEVLATGRSNTTDGKVRHRLVFYEDALTDGESDATDATPETTDEDDDAESGDARAETDPARREAPAGDVVVVDEGEFETLRERVDALERDNERLREQVDENAEALPDAETARELNAAAERVNEVDDLREELNDLRDMVETINGNAAPRSTVDELTEQVDALTERVVNDGPNDDLAEAIATLRDSGIGVELSINANHD